MGEAGCRESDVDQLAGHNRLRAGHLSQSPEESVSGRAVAGLGGRGISELRQVLPRTKIVGGFERATRIQVNTVLPEESAKMLRECEECEITGL